MQGLTVASNPESPIIYLRLKKSTGSMKDDLRLLEDIAKQVCESNLITLSVHR